MSVCLSLWLQWNDSALTHLSRNEDTVTEFRICHVVLAKGVHRSDIGPLGQVASICATPANRRMDRQTPDVRLCDKLC